jgi:CDP-6-deoxy-D-xylo-4-hexulose-3-dehydrase
MVSSTEGSLGNSSSTSESEKALFQALEAVFTERAATRPASKYAYPLSQVTYDTTEIAAVCDALLSTETTMGRRVEEFERRFADLHGGGHAVMVNSGSSADLIAALLLVDPENRRLEAGDEVLAPAVTWPTQIDSLLMAGLSVRLVDVVPETLQMDLDDLEAKIGPRTRALSLVHLMGNPCDMTRVRDICERHDLVLLEDCCESLGATWRGQPVGTFGLAGTYSFFFSHHMTTMEGGMVLVQDEETADAVRLLRAHGWSRNVRHRDVASTGTLDGRYKFLTWGLNVRPMEVSGAFGLVQLDRLSGFQQQRRENAELFASLLEPAHEHVQLMREPDDGVCSWFALPMLVSPTSPVNRDALANILEREGVETRPVVAGNLARQPMMRLFPQIQADNLPGADFVHERGLYLGLHPFADEAALKRVAVTIVDAVLS